MAKIYNTNWVTAQLAMKFGYTDSKFETLHNLLQSCTFTQMMEGLRADGDAKQEETTTASILDKLELLYSGNKVKLTQEVRNKTKKLNQTNEKIEVLREQMSDEEWRCDKLEATVTSIKSAQNAGKKTMTVQRYRKAITDKTELIGQLEEQIKRELAEFKRQRDEIV